MAGQKKRSKLEPTTNRYVEPSVFFRYPLLQILICPLVLLAVDVNLSHEVQLDRSMPYHSRAQEWVVYFFHHLPYPTLLAVKMMGMFALFETLLLRFVPGKIGYGPVSPMGDRPMYRLNGVPCFLITLAAFVLGSSEFGYDLYHMGIVVENLGEIVMTSILSVKVLVFLLYLKGVYAPSDNVVKPNDFWYNYFWGVELYPSVWGLSLKQLVNCRLGMMSWPIIVISCCFYQQNVYGYISNSMMVSAILQMIYLFKFYVWESGYLSSIDIMHDRFGYYLCWGCLCWVPGYYTMPGLWLAHHPIDLPQWLAIGLTTVGFFSIISNYLADRQRQSFRDSQGKGFVWGKKPVSVHAKYVTVDGKERTNLLLASGWWGISRHFHYVPELLGTLCWSLPALDNGVFPYGYFLMLVILLFDRQLRDEERCKTKYGDGWDQYCKLVPWKIIPYIY